jgi:hypothetical protein
LRYDEKNTIKANNNNLSIEQAADAIFNWLRARGYSDI